MNVAHCIILLAASGREKGIQGRTLLQKRMFFLSQLLNENMEFHAHYYGPYSSTVATDLDRMVMAGFLSEEAAIIASNGNPFEDVRRYTYRLTEDGERLQQHLSPEMKEAEETLEQLEKQPVWNNPRHLIIAAKLYFLLKETNAASSWPDLVSKAQELGWEISEEDISQAEQFLKAMGLLDAFMEK